jgi:hypothetical protein
MTCPSLDKVSLEILRVSSKIKPVVDESGVSLEIKIKTSSVIRGITNPADPVKEPEIMEEKISPYQLLASMFVLPYGSAILYFLAADAKQDVWFSVLFYIIPALLLQLVYIKLFNYYPEDTLTTYLSKIFGKLIGGFLSIIYVLYFLYLSASVLGIFLLLLHLRL